MLAGVGSIDMALVVIAADESVMPQTREHIAILELLKINIGAIAITKIDLVEKDIVDLGKQLAMKVASLSPIAVDKDGLDSNILEKEKEIITEELKNSGKDTKIVEKIAIGKLNKFDFI